MHTVLEIKETKHRSPRPGKEWDVILQSTNCTLHYLNTSRGIHYWQGISYPDGRSQ
jgi:hypothetical protein